jgi:alpha-tubulin suppressor-like RCC1 family protein
LGTGSFVDSPPTPVSGLTDAIAVASGLQHSCALRVGGSMVCWGANDTGQLGNGTTTRSTIPIAVPGMSGVVAIAAGGFHTCAVLSSGSVRCWGDNSRGQLGRGSFASSLSPAIVQNLTTAVSIAAGLEHTCAVLAVGTAMCWGRNSSGQLGVIATTDQNTPQAVVVTVGPTASVNLTGVVAISAGQGGATDAHTCAVTAQGVIRCWGSNSRGQIGDGTNINRPRPTVVNGFSANVAPQGSLRLNRRLADLTGLVSCEAGSRAQFFLTLTQGSVTGYGVASAACADALQEIPITAPAHGRAGFQPGAATASLEAVIRNGSETDRLTWTREVVLTAP